MAIQRQNLQAAIYEILGKDPTAYGFLTPTKVNNAIQDSLNYIATKMMKVSNGWLTQVVYADITGGSATVPLPSGIAIINFVKKLDGAGNYAPIDFAENAKGVTGTTPVATSTMTPSWRFSGSSILLEPTPKDTQTAGLMIDGVFYPTQLAGDTDLIGGDFDNQCFITYAKWRAASVLYSLTSSDVPPWARLEAEWKQSALELIARRFREPTTIRDFDCY